MILIERHKLIFDKCLDLLKVCLNEDKDVLELILNKSKDFIDNHNKQNLSVINPSKYELGKLKASIKTIIRGVYVNPIIKEIPKPELSDYEFICKKCRIYEYDGDEWEHLDFIKDDWYYDERKLCKSCKTQLNELDKIHDGYYDKTVSVRKKFADLCDNTNYSIHSK